jgi:hypothetical protein
MNIDHAVQSIFSFDKPVILSDTCAMLDIFRVQHRVNINISHVVGFNKIIELIKKDSIKSVLSYTVKDEYLKNVECVSVELDKTINKLIQNNERFISILEIMGLSYEFHLSGIENTKLLQTLKRNLEYFIENSIILDKDEGLSGKALQRLEKNEAPSSSNKQEMKDCLIIEHYLGLSEQLRSKNFGKKIFFITSNASDYGGIDNLKAPLDTQFLRWDIAYRNNYNWVVTDLS